MEEKGYRKDTILSLDDALQRNCVIKRKECFSLFKENKLASATQIRWNDDN